MDHIPSACALLAWAGFAYKLIAYRRSAHNHALKWLCYALAFLALGLTLSYPPVSGPVDRLLHFPDVAVFLSQCCVTAMVACQQIVLVYWGSDSIPQARYRARGKIAIAVLFLTARVVLFLLLPPDERRAGWFSLHYAHHPGYVVFLSLHVAFYVFGEAEIACRSYRYARASRRRWLRRGLFLIAIGTSLTLCWGAIRMAELVLFPLSPATGWSTFASLCGNTGAMMTLIGWTLPGWGPLLCLPSRWLRACLQYRRLRPLWSAVRAAVPEVELKAPPAHCAMCRISLSALEFALYRQVIEIRDGQLALRENADTDVARTAEKRAREAGLSGDRLRAVVEAAQLMWMLHAATHALPPRSPQAPPAITGPGRSDLAGETAWLTEVAKAFTRSPIVQSFGRGMVTCQAATRPQGRGRER